MDRATRLHAERGSASILYVLGALAAIAAVVVPLVLAVRTHGEAVQGATVVAGEAETAQADLLLRQAIVAAELHFAEHGSYEGLTPEVASGLDPATTYNSSPVAVPREVSIRAATPLSVLLVTRADDDRPFCAVASPGGARFGDAYPIAADGCA